MLDEAVPPLHNGRYQLRSILGAGGMATVYLARDGLLQVDRAIKVLAPHLSRRRSIRERFLLEARSMAKIAAPGVVRVFDFGQDGDRVFLVMEVVTGGSLMDRIETEGPIAPTVAARLIADALDGLAAAHAAGFVHRDVKPHNILLTPDELPKLTDFGIAAAQTRESALTRTGTVMGTWAYMAPEQRTDAKRADPRSDLYSMGATLFACVTGAEPFDLYVEQVAAELPQRMPPALAEVVRRATRYTPEERYTDAEEMAAALRALPPDALDPTTTDTAAPPEPAPGTLVPAASGVSSSTFDPIALEVPPSRAPALDGPTQTRPPPAEVPTAPTPTRTLLSEAPATVPRTRRWLGPVAGGVLLVAAAVVFVPPALEDATEPVPVAAEPPRRSTPPAATTTTPAAEPAPPTPKEPAPAALPPQEASDDASPPASTEPTPPPKPAPPASSPPAARQNPAPEKRRQRTPIPTPPPPDEVEDDAGTTDAEPLPPGRVFLNSRPYSVVSIDGVQVGPTPIRGHSLPAGLHPVTFRTNDGKTVRYEVQVEPNENVRLCWDLEAEDFCR